MIRATTVLVLLVVVVGCADEYHPPVWTTDQYNRPPDQTDKNERILSIDSMTASVVCTSNLALQGYATPEADVFAISGNQKSTIQPANPQTGRFCVDVPLAQGSQKISVYAQHPKLGLIGPVEREVTYDPNGCNDQQQPAAQPVDTEERKNIAVHAPVRSMNQPDINPSDYVTDGNPTTWTKWSKYEQAWLSNHFWVTMSLGGLHRINEINIKWRDSEGSGTDYATTYELLYTQNENPGDPDPNNGLWVRKPITGGNGGDDPFTLGDELVYHVALWLVDDADPSMMALSEKYAISEIQVWRNPRPLINEQPTSGGGNTCSTIGSGYY
jgi:hypothetical protein